MVEKLPINQNGKIDRSRLKPVDIEDPQGMGADQGRVVEERLAAIWQELLAVEQIGLDDDFFELGGHSLLAVELLEGIETKFGVRIPAQRIYLEPTVRSVAAAIMTALARNEASNE
jgi:acyl carrier protein